MISFRTFGLFNVLQGCILYCLYISGAENRNYDGPVEFYRVVIVYVKNNEKNEK